MADCNVGMADYISNKNIMQSHLIMYFFSRQVGKIETQNQENNPEGEGEESSKHPTFSTSFLSFFLCLTPFKKEIEK